MLPNGVVSEPFFCNRYLGPDAMEMHQVRYFLGVARTPNFTRAAEECNVSQPSLTRAIGKRLFPFVANFLMLSRRRRRCLSSAQRNPSNPASKNRSPPP